MAIPENVPRWEKVVRIILAVVLITMGWVLSGYWRLAAIAGGCFFLLTVFVGY
jgi:hypothetical protein